MKTEKIEQLMLLEQSGELGFIGRWQLRHALATQPELAKFRDELEAVTRASREAALPGCEVPADVLGEIRKAAAEQNTHPVPLDVMFGSWLRPAIALAAILVTITGIGVVNHLQDSGEPLSVARQTSAWNDGFDNELTNLDRMLAANFDAAESLDADSLARELLQLEGISQ